MSIDIDEYLSMAGGNWYTARVAEVGDRLLILDEGKIDAETFKGKDGKPRAYLIFKVKLQRTGEEYDLRLGPRNVKRIRDSFGTTRAAEWKGRQLEVISIEEYKGLGQKGCLFRGLPPEPKQTALSELSKTTLDYIQAQKTVIQYGLDTKAALNEMDFNAIPFVVRAELLKKGLVEKTEKGYIYTEKIRDYL